MKNQTLTTFHSVILVIVFTCSLVVLFDHQGSQFNSNSTIETTQTLTPKPGFEHLTYKK